MAKITNRFLDSSLHLQLTGMQVSIAGLTGAVSILTPQVSSNTAGLTAARSDIAGLTGAVSTLTTQVSSNTV